MLSQMEWWKKLVGEEGVYVEIRKDNVVDVYFKGRLVAKLEVKRGVLKASCHKKYLMSSKESGYVDCREKLETNYKDIINGIEDYVQSKKHANEEDISEKEIHGRMIAGSIQEKLNYFIDSEFAHRYEDGKSSTVRFDMIAIVGNQLHFLELKRIQDSRLLDKNDDNPEVLVQMEKYANFMKENAEALQKYYKKLYHIKKELGLPVPDCNIDKLQVNEKPHLVICNTYPKKTSKRDTRIKGIKEILDNKSDKFSWSLDDIKTIHDILKFIQSQSTESAE